MEALPIKSRHTEERRGRGGREKRQKQRDAEGGASPHEKTGQHRRGGEERGRVNNPSKCAVFSNKQTNKDTNDKDAIHIQHTSDHLPTLDLNVHEQ